MRRRRAKVGIERKILTSILFVSIFPMVMAWFVGYLTARQQQNTAVEQTLSTIAAKTANGIARAAGDRLQLARAIMESAEAETLVTSDGPITDDVPAAIEIRRVFDPLLAWQSADPQDADAFVAFYKSD